MPDIRHFKLIQNPQNDTTLEETFTEAFQTRIETISKKNITVNPAAVNRMKSLMKQDPTN